MQRWFVGFVLACRTESAPPAPAPTPTVPADAGVVDAHVDPVEHLYAIPMRELSHDAQLSQIRHRARVLRGSRVAIAHDTPELGTPHDGFVADHALIARTADRVRIVWSRRSAVLAVWVPLDSLADVIVAPVRLETGMPIVGDAGVYLEPGVEAKLQARSARYRVTLDNQTIAAEGDVPSAAVGKLWVEQPLQGPTAARPSRVYWTPRDTKTTKRVVTAGTHLYLTADEEESGYLATLVSDFSWPGLYAERSGWLEIAVGGAGWRARGWVRTRDTRVQRDRDGGFGIGGPGRGAWICLYASATSPEPIGAARLDALKGVPVDPSPGTRAARSRVTLPTDWGDLALFARDAYTPGATVIAFELCRAD